MTTPMLQVLPYTPDLHPLNVFSVQHLKHALAIVHARDVIATEGTAPTTVAGCALVGGGLMALASMAAHTVVQHEQRHLTDIHATDINAVVVLQGSGNVHTADSDFDFAARDVFFLKAHWPSTVRVDSDCHMLILRLPFSRFSLAQRSKFSDFAPSLGLPESALRLALWNYVHQVMPSLGGSSLSVVAHAEQAFVALLAAVYAEARQAAWGPARSDSRWDTLVSALDALLPDADLSVTRLSAVLGMSTRRVHRLFADNGQRYSAFVLQKRLERAHQELRSPVHADLSVAEIGYRAGFNNASHFSRSFKQHYGSAPSLFRSASQA
jgi:AraC-like DNA-binding protein